MEKLKDKKIDDKEKIIQLQTQLIEQKDQQLNDVKETITTELKSYSSVVQESCSAALAPGKIVCSKERPESEDRSRNVVAFGLRYEQEKSLDSKVSGTVGRETSSNGLSLNWAGVSRCKAQKQFIRY